MRDGFFIGRFQPVHAGHVEAIRASAAQVKTLHVLIGSSNTCRSTKNPWTFQERKEKVTDELTKAGIRNFRITPLNDYFYSDSQWATDVRATMEFLGVKNPIMFGHTKEGNNYLKWFPEWEYCEVGSSIDISSTFLREVMYRTKKGGMPDTVHDDFEYYEKEAKAFANYPYPTTLNFNCADAVVECQGHVLLIKRARAPGRGSWALPGGFRENIDATFLDAAIRELTEEVNIRVPEKVLRGSIVKTELFDSIKRSFGIPRNTLAVYIRINPNNDGTLPRVSPHVNGVDGVEVMETKWFTLTEVLNSVNLYDDHKGIVSKLTGVMPMPAFVSIK